MPEERFPGGNNRRAGCVRVAARLLRDNRGAGFVGREEVPFGCATPTDPGSLGC